MSSLGTHLRLTPRSAQLGVTVRARRLIARAVLRLGRTFGLLAFGTADNHFHARLLCGVRNAIECGRRLALSFGKQLGLVDGFEPAFAKPISDLRHAYTSFDYVHRQDERHDLEPDPGAEGTSLPDLLGLRPLGAYLVTNVRRYLPRVQRWQLLQRLGVAEFEACDGPLEMVPEAARAASALTTLAGKGADAMDARRAAVEVIGDRLTQRQTSSLLDISKSALHRLRERAVDNRLVSAIRLQLGLRARRVGGGVVDWAAGKLCVA